MPDDFIEDPSESDREDETTRAMRKWAKAHRDEWEERKKELNIKDSSKSTGTKSGCLVFIACGGAALWMVYHLIS